MHELAIAESIIKLAEAEAQKHSASCINGIKLRIGQFTGVVREALEFSLEAIKKGTLAENAEIEIEVVKLRGRCRTCNRYVEPSGDLILLCPTCGGPIEIIEGREMQVEYIDIG